MCHITLIHNNIDVQITDKYIEYITYAMEFNSITKGLKNKNKLSSLNKIYLFWIRPLSTYEKKKIKPK